VYVFACVKILISPSSKRFDVTLAASCRFLAPDQPLFIELFAKTISRVEYTEECDSCV